MSILEVPNRYLAGIAEVALKAYVSDKTSWQKMLKNDIFDGDLNLKKEELVQYLPEEVHPYILDASENILDLNYPVNQYPTKIKSLNIIKADSYEGVLKGVKGQYLSFLF